MASKRLRELLDQHHVKYVVTVHSPAYTAPEIAQHAHVRGRSFAKTVLVRAGPNAAIAVLPATHHIEFAWLSRVLEYDDVRLATEDECRRMFDDCEAGAMPPFGSMYGLRLLCDTSMAGSSDIVFNAGNHHEVIRMSFHDWVAIARPQFASFATGSATPVVV